MKAIDPGSRDKGRNDSQGFSLIPGGRFVGDSDGHLEPSGPAGAREYRAGILKVPHRMEHPSLMLQIVANARTRFSIRFNIQFTGVFEPLQCAYVVALFPKHYSEPVVQVGKTGMIRFEIRLCNAQSSFQQRLSSFEVSQ